METGDQPVVVAAAAIEAALKDVAEVDPVFIAVGSDTPVAWWEAHPAGSPWAGGGRTDLVDGVLRCSWHRHSAHDYRYGTASHRAATSDSTVGRGPRGRVFHAGASHKTRTCSSIAP